MSDNIISGSKRKVFAKDRETLPMQDLIEIQKKSYEWFLKDGIKELFEEVFPVKDWVGRDLELYFLNHYLDEPKFDEITAKEKNVTYEATLRVKAKLVNKKTKKVKEQEVFLGDFPLMTNRGTFIINGIERVVVSQLIRSPGVFFTSENNKGREHYGAKIIPNRGAWIEIETDSNDIIWIKIDRKRKVAATSLLRAFGYENDADIINLFADIDDSLDHTYIANTLEKDMASSQADGLQEIYKRIRPGDLATTENAKSLIFAMFFNFDRYDFGKVGRYKINQRFSSSKDAGIYGNDLPITPKNRVLRKEDLIVIIREIIRLNKSQEDADDIDHLGNRRIRAVGELVQNRLRVGLARMERIAKDRMSTFDIHALTPTQLVNARPIIGVVREFFMSSQLSQFMDQTNPLAELEHKRRISAMGPGGLSRERAGFEVRDVHRTFYGRVCPIATSEGPNIGLIGHLASHARLNEYGFLETPYRKVIHDVLNKKDRTEGEILREDVVVKKGKSKETIAKKGEKISKEMAGKLERHKEEIKLIPIVPRVTNEIIYLNAIQDEKNTIVAATVPLDENNGFLSEKVEARICGRPGFSDISTIDYMDVSPGQFVSIGTSLIPFLEHDDAVRALMGTNMQRQAIACIKPEAPIVGTGVEKSAARDSGHLIIAEESGNVVAVDSLQIQIADSNKKIHTYRLHKFSRTNASTCFNQKPTVEKGQTVRKGDVIADGTAIEKDELALGQNVLVAFMSWEGWNYEDAILISDKLVQDDRYSSIHIEEYSIDVRDTKLGPEIVTNDIPNISEEKLKNLDEDGIVRIGAQVSSGDILVGKITPKGETELSAEEKLLRAIFGEKAKDVRDSSLYLEHGEHGKVVDIKIFSRENGDKLPTGVIKSIQVTVADLRKVQVGDKMSGRHGNKGVISKIIPREDLPFLADGTPVDIILNPLGVASRMNLGQILETHLGMAAKSLGYKVTTAVFNGVKESKIKDELERAGFPRDGKVQLYDGRTGEPFKQKVTVGYNYIMKLNHLVEDKIHQRSIGPYSLITQQPMGGKARFGGQRFGEMEVWALEAYGVAHTLQEMLTIKSDDVYGRSKTYESIIKGEPIEKVNLPESFNVLDRELKGLCLNIELLKEGRKIDLFQEGNDRGGRPERPPREELRPKPYKSQEIKQEEIEELEAEEEEE